MKIVSRLWLFLGVLIVLSPLGLILPGHFKAGGAWGEWGADEMKALVGYIPEGLEKLSNLWSAPIPDYAFQGWQDKPLSNLSIAYIFSAFVGVAACASLLYILGKLLVKK
jgi:hypothetical protein